MQKEYFSNNFNKNIFDLIKKDWLDNLYFICDFDNTINHLFTIDWRKVPWLISFLEREEFGFPQDWIIEMRDLFLKYYPIEIGPNIDNESKKSIMRDWWILVFKVLWKYWLNKEQIINISKHIDIRIRQWFFGLLKLLNEQNIQVIIFSASGLWKICIEKVIRK